RDGIYSIVQWDEVTARHFAEEASDGYDRRTILKLAALLHDIAKPQTKAPDETGRIRFLGHQSLGAQMAEAICQRLRLSSRGVRMVSAMLEHHLRPTQMAQGAELPTARAVYRYFRDLDEVAVDTLYLCLADYLAAKGPTLDVKDWERHVRIVAHILEAGLVERAPSKSRWLVNGHDLMEALGLTPGPSLGDVLDAVHEAQAVGEVASREEALEWAGRYVRKIGVAPR
ncbi:MAG: HD domain-containing protein, partial [Chloroflexota bacterium]|nr:HD domain-containing protein [Chloroflexota bacterium]